MDYNCMRELVIGVVCATGSVYRQLMLFLEKGLSN